MDTRLAAVLEHAGLSHIREVDAAFYPRNDPSIFTKKDERPLYHGEKESEGWEKQHQLIVRRLDEVLDEQIKRERGHLPATPPRNELMSRLILGRDGNKLTPRDAKYYRNEPEKLDTNQLAEICERLGCTVDWLQATTDDRYSTASAPYVGSGDLNTAWASLIPENREIAFKVILGLIALQNTLNPFDPNID